MKYFVLLILSFFPILSFSDDSYFGTITKKRRDLRLSLIKIPLGNVVFHFFSYSFSLKKFSFIKIIDFFKIQKLLSSDNVDQKIEKFKENLDGKNKKDIDIQTEYLKYKIEQEQKIKSIQHNKITLLSAILLPIIPVFVVYININSMLDAIFVVIILLCFMNIFIWVWAFSKTKSVIRSTFRDIKDSENIYIQAVTSYYL